MRFCCVVYRALFVIIIILGLNIYLIPSAFAKQVWSEQPVIFMVEPLLPVSGQGFRLPDGLKISADSAILMDASTGQILYAKNHYVRRPIASTTKIMTALLALENGNLNKIITVSRRAASEEGSSLYLHPGEKLTIEELVYGALICSGNDACVALAEGVAGREDIFVEFMNYKARWMGAKHTTFKNTNGMPADGHLSCAYDLALVTRHAFQNDIFNLMVSTRTKAISGPGAKSRHLSNTNQMLWGYKGADGVKTGTTNAAGRCLVASATRNGRRLISVVLHSDDRYSDSIALLDYGFTNFENKTVLSRGEIVKKVKVKDGEVPETTIVSSKDVEIAVPVKRSGSVKTKISLPGDMTAPVKQGQLAGKILAMVDGEPVAESSLITAAGVPELPPHKLLVKKTLNTLANYFNGVRRS